jgi:hypothetical protein
MVISYGITVCDELEEIKRLVDFLLLHKREQDEIVVLLDDSKGKGEVYDYLLTTPPEVTCYRDQFQGHFADWKNKLTSYCKGDYIMNIDADEIPSEGLIKGLPFILEQNSTIDMYLIPRVNTVSGITQEHVGKWGWNVNEKGWLNYPDFQMRIYKNLPKIKWGNKVHEVLSGYSTWAALPIEDEEFVLYHPKTISKQEKQNNYYDTL